MQPDLAEAHYNLGTTLRELGRLGEAEAHCRQAIALKPDYPEAHHNLGISLKELERLDEAEASYRQAIVLQPDFAEAHNNLGITLQELGRLDEAEASYRQAIALKPDFAKAYSSLGMALLELGRLDEAEESCRRALTLESDYALGHFNLGRVLYAQGCKGEALISIDKASHLDPHSKQFGCLSAILKAKNGCKEDDISATDEGLSSNPLILNRVVELELVKSLYGMASRTLDNTHEFDPRHGVVFALPILICLKIMSLRYKKLAKDLTKLMMRAVKSDIFVFESFFNILRAGGGVTPHNHIGPIDTIIEGLNMENRNTLWFITFL